MDELLNAISMVGFPIVAYGVLFWYLATQDRNHKSEVDLLREAINTNTMALIELRESINANSRT